MRGSIVALLVVVAVGCSKQPTAIDVCRKIEASGVGANCRASTPEGLGAAAVERAEFDLPSVPGKGASVMRFDREPSFTITEDAFTKAAMLAGPHRYGNRKALIFVQANSGLSLDDGKTLRGVVDAL